MLEEKKEIRRKYKLAAGLFVAGSVLLFAGSLLGFFVFEIISGFILGANRTTHIAQEEFDEKKIRKANHITGAIMLVSLVLSLILDNKFGIVFGGIAGIAFGIIIVHHQYEKVIR